ncbi:MAG: hypothetical protein ACYDHB_10335 [Candidatus Dormibacteria bacterium]
MPYADPELRRRVNREALRHKRATARRQVEPASSPTPQWSPPVPPPVAHHRHTGVLGTPEQRRLRNAPPTPAGGPYLQIVAAGVGPLSPFGPPSVSVIAAVLVVAGLVVGVVYYFGTHQSAAEAFDLIG